MQSFNRQLCNIITVDKIMQVKSICKCSHETYDPYQGMSDKQVQIFHKLMAIWKQALECLPRIVAKQTNQKIPVIA